MRTILVSAAAAALVLSGLVGCERREGDRTSGTRDARRDTTDTARDTGPRTMRDRGDETAASADQAFVTSAAQANIAEVEAGKLAVEKSTNADVKSFAQHMIDDHSAANRDLTDLARKKGFTVPEGTDEDHRKDAEKLRELQGGEFDKKYASMMVTDHVRAVALFEANAKAAKDKDLRAFAEKTAPKLRDHLKMARDLNAKLTGQPSAD